MPTPSPVCLVNGSPPPAVVSSGASVTGALQSPAGAQFWTLSCTDSDETSSAAAINATLTLNQTLKTFAFTMFASLGTAARFTSTVGIAGPGLDANGVRQASYTTTFKVNVLAANGLPVVTTNEIQDQSAAYGWIVELNQAIRAAGVGGGVVIPTPPGVGTTVLTDTSGSLSWAAAGGASGAQPPIDFTLTTATTTSSSNSIGSTSKVWRFYVNVTAAYGGAGAVTLSLGHTGSSSLLCSGVDLTQSGIQVFDVVVPWGGSSLPVLATISGSPSVGAAEITVLQGPVLS